MPQALATRGPATQAIYVAAPRPAQATRIKVDIFVVRPGQASAFPVPLAIDMSKYLAPLSAEARRMGRISEEADSFTFEPDQDQVRRSISERFYIPRRPELWQGDVFKLTPQVYVASRPLIVLRAETAGGGRHRFGGYPEGTQPSASFKADEDGDVLASGRVDTVVLLTYDSELDKDDKYRQVALVRRLDSVSDPVQREALRQELVDHKRLRFFFLPGQTDDPPFDERYVDLRRVTTVRGQVLNPDDRIASMTDALREGLRTQFVRFYARGKLTA